MSHTRDVRPTKCMCVSARGQSTAAACIWGSHCHFKVVQVTSDRNEEAEGKKVDDAEM